MAHFTHRSSTCEAKEPSQFPLSFKKSFYQWRASLSPAAAESKLLSYVSNLGQLPLREDNADGNDAASCWHESNASNTTPSLPPSRQWELNTIKLSGENRSIHELHIRKVNEATRNTLVVLHGYGAGIGFWYKNYDALSSVPGWELYSLDLLGMGRSSRPKFEVYAKNEAERVTQAEDWFVDALEEWRINKGLESFTLMAHSLGGYLAVSYGLKYPGHLQKLILVSPLGMLGNPSSAHEHFTGPLDKNGPIEQLRPIQHGTTLNNLRSNDQRLSMENTEAAPLPVGPAESHYPKWLSPLWNVQISPFTALRYTGPLGPKLMSGWSSRRFRHLPAEEAQALHDYSYSIFMLPSSGEFVLSHILTPELFARRPLVRRIHNLGRQYFQPCRSLILGSALKDSTHKGSANSGHLQIKTLTKMKREKAYPIVFFYGENDWMDRNGGYVAQHRILARKDALLKHATQEEKCADGGNAKVFIVPNAGHIVHLDEWEYFNSRVCEEMREMDST